MRAALRFCILLSLCLAGFAPGAFGAGSKAVTTSSDYAALGEVGPYAIGFTTFVLDDPSRPGDGAAYATRPIPVYVWYPVDPQSVSGSADAVYPLDPLYMTDLLSTSSDWEAVGMDPAYQEPTPSADGPFPLVMFSPGWGSPAWGHMSIGTRLASHGYVVAVLYHFGDQWWPWEPPFDHVALASWNRPRDVSFALTALLERNQTNGDLLEGAIRPDQVAASGWSLGGYASMVLAVGDDIVCDIFQAPDWVEWFGPPPPESCSPSSTDPRIKLIMPLDGSNQVLHFSELSRMNLPVMGMGEEWNAVFDWQARQHAAFSSRPSYRVDVFNTNHQSFSDWCPLATVLGALGIWPPDFVASWQDMMCAGITPWEDSRRLVTQYMIAFLKNQFGHDGSMHSMLTPGYAISSEPLIEFFVAEKRSPRSIDQDWPDQYVYFAHQPGKEQSFGKKDPFVTLGLTRSAAAAHMPQLPAGARQDPVVSRAPTQSYLNQNVPNPFNPQTKIEFGLTKPSAVALSIYDVAGRLVRVVAQGQYSAGNHVKSWDGRDDNGRSVSSGVYFYRLTTNGLSQTRKMVLLK